MREHPPTSRADLADAVCIAEVSSAAPGKSVWTDLSIWYRRGADRPFVTVIEGKVAEQAEEHGGMVPRFRALCCGTLIRAIEVLEPTMLREELVNALPEGADTLYPDSNTLRMIEAEERRASRGYMGPVKLAGALYWLYPHLEHASDNALATKFEMDFGIGSRTTRNILRDERAGETGPSWIEAFVEALRFFDRKAWENRNA